MGRDKPKFTARERWMQTFEGYVLEAMPEQRGKIEWESATHFFNIGMASSAAAFKYIANRKQEG